MNEPEQIPKIITNPYVVGIFFLFLQWAINKLGSFLSQRMNTRDPRLNGLLFVVIFFIWFLSIGIFLYLSYILNDKTVPLIFAVISTIFFVYTIWRNLYQYWNLGIVGADTQASNGLDYDKSLKLCQSSLAFHGIGASKLTNSKEFEAALLRCKQGKTIKFLLLDPKDKILLSAAKRADKDQQCYHKIVNESLLNLKKIKEQRELDIQVRFYTGKPLFRLMFIDDTLCLLSAYTQFGVDDGSKLPQVHLRNFTNHQHSKSLYSPFEAYFNQLWEDATPWDFKELQE